MAERCNNCGAELFTGQQFCRACGTPTRKFSSEELPTQILSPGGQEQQQQPTTPQPPLATSPLPGRDTSDPIFGTDYSRYQPPPMPQRVTAPVVAPLPHARRGSRAWLYAVLGLLLFFAGASVVAGLFFLNRQTQRVTKTRTVRPNITVPVPPIPPPHSVDAGEEGAETFGDESVITKTYPLAKNGSFSLRNFSGDITVEGWDEQQAEVKVVRRGGGDAERVAFHVTREEGANRLVFNSTPEKTGGVQEVEYVLKLPRNLRELEIVSINSDVDLVNVHSASISINVQQGNIELEDVSGTINSRTTKGNTTVVLAEAAKGAPHVFNGIHGNIEIELAPGTNAELKAETVDGNIDIDEDLGIKVEKRIIGQQAVGRLGTGGQPIVVKVVSGNIRIKS